MTNNEGILRIVYHLTITIILQGFLILILIHKYLTYELIPRIIR